MPRRHDRSHHRHSRMEQRQRTRAKRICPKCRRRRTDEESCRAKRINSKERPGPARTTSTEQFRASHRLRKGCSINISDIIRKHEVGFTNEIEEKIGDIDEYRLQNDCIRIECVSAEQLVKLLAVTTFLDEAVTLSLPWTGSQKTMEKARVADNKPVR